MAETKAQRLAHPFLLATGMLWAALSFWLWSDGHMPSAPWQPFGKEQHYAAQALLILPLLLLMNLAAFAVRKKLVSHPSMARAMGLALLPFIAAELVAYGLFGFEALAITARALALAALVAIALDLRTLRRAGSSWPKAAAATFVGLLAQALIGAPIIR